MPSGPLSDSVLTASRISGEGRSAVRRLRNDLACASVENVVDLMEGLECEGAGVGSGIIVWLEFVNGDIGAEAGVGLVMRKLPMVSSASMLKGGKLSPQF